MMDAGLRKIFLLCLELDFQFADWGYLDSTCGLGRVYAAERAARLA